jgi:predicted RNA-binding protein with RPS1 domain
MIEEITAEAEIGAVYTGSVERIVDFGAFVNILPGKDGLLHISQIANERVENVTDHLSEGDEVGSRCLTWTSAAVSSCPSRNSSKTRRHPSTKPARQCPAAARW